MNGHNYIALSKAYGGDGIRLDDSIEAEAVVLKAMAAEGLFIIHICADPNVKADMAAFKDNSLTVMNSGSCLHLDAARWRTRLIAIFLREMLAAYVKIRSLLMIRIRIGIYTTFYDVMPY